MAEFPHPFASLDNLESLLATLRDRYQTPLPEAYLSEALTKQQGQRRQQGAFYTPWPLAQYLMRSAEEIARREFPVESCTWLDPACGGGVFFWAHLSKSTNPTGAFLGWDASPFAIELAKSIGKTHQLALPRFEHRSALLFDPRVEPSAFGAGPLIVVGNPPYSNFGQRAISPWLQRELAAYRPPHGERKTNLRNAFLLFLRLAESLITHQGRGLLAMVLSTTFLDALTSSEVRRSLQNTFDELHILRLDARDTPDAEHLFSLRQTTAACLFLRRTAHSPASFSLFESQLAGDRAQKLTWLSQNSAATTSWKPLEAPAAPSTPWKAATAAPSWYTQAPPLSEIFTHYISGVQTKNDDLFLARTRSELESKIRARFGAFDPAHVQTILVGPFDPWWIYYDARLLGRARHSVMQHMLRDNLGLVFMRQATTSGDYDHFLVTRSLVTDRIFHSRWGAPFLAPLYLPSAEGHSANVSEEVDLSLRERNDPLRAESWLAYAYALLHSHWYRTQAGETVRTDFPRIPPREHFAPTLVNRLTELGQSLIELHAPQAGWTAFQSGDETPSPLFIAHRYPKTEPLGEKLRIFANPTAPLADVAPEVWNYRLGGVQVLKKFLMRRRRTNFLSWEAAHFREVCDRLNEGLLLQRQVDSLFESP